VVVIDLEHRLILNVVIFPAWVAGPAGQPDSVPKPTYFWRLPGRLALGFGILYASLQIWSSLFVR